MSDAERAQKLRELLEEAHSLDVTIHSDDEARAHLDWRARKHNAPPENYRAATLGADICVICVRPRYADMPATFVYCERSLSTSNKGARVVSILFQLSRRRYRRASR